TFVWGISPRQPSGKNIIRWLLKKRTNGSVRYCQYTSERLAVRKARSVQLMQSLYDWIQLQRKTLSKHAEMAKAFDYILNHWNALNEFCRDGWVEIDNNIGENALRSVAVGRKNYLFFGSDKGGESAAIIYSLLVTCKQNEVEPEDWLREVIEKLNDWPSNQVHELLPWNFSSVK
ncbi:IS66 family transposase, partial [Shigella flexneri]|uniref:IS66 family transposase n=8 Tax=Shigella flexneri TaxID=623 RepID=UPI002094D680